MVSGPQLRLVAPDLQVLGLEQLLQRLSLGNVCARITDENVVLKWFAHKGIPIDGLI